MLHPALTRALATAHIEDQRRAAARRHAIRLARRAAHEPHPAACAHEDAEVVARTASYTNSFTSQWSANGSSLNGCTSTQPVER